MKTTISEPKPARKAQRLRSNKISAGLVAFFMLFAAFSGFTTSRTAQAEPVNPETNVTLAGPSSAQIGSQFTYTINISQAVYDASNVEVSLPISYGLDYISASQVSGSGSFTCGYDAGNFRALCTMSGTFAVGATASFNVVVQVNTNSSPGRDIYNEAQTNSKYGGTIYSNTVITHVPANISVAINGPAKILPGSNVTYKVLVKNSGAYPVPYVNLTENYPVELAYVSSDLGSCTIEPTSVKSVRTFGMSNERTIYCELLDIQPGETRVITLNFMSAGELGTCFLNTATTNVRGLSSINAIKNATSGEIATTSLTTCFALPTVEVAPAADLIAQLRVTPDRTVNIAPTTDISYTLTVKNIGVGTANRVRINFPYDPNLTVGYATFSDPRMWVSAVVTDAAQPYVTVELPNMQNNEEFITTLVLRPSATATNGATIFNRFTVGWDDGNKSGNQAGSNGVRFSLTGGSLDNKGGEVQLFNPAAATVANGQSQVISGDFFAPDEMVSFWYTDKDGNSTALGTALAGSDGSISITIAPVNLVAGQQYVVAGYGNRSGVYGSSVITIGS